MLKKIVLFITLIIMMIAIAIIVVHKKKAAFSNEKTERLILRSKPTAISISNDDVERMIKKFNFFDRLMNPSGKGMDNLFQLQAINGDTVVVDEATGLMWQQNGSLEAITYEKAEGYIKELNRKGFAGFHDWRLPTLEEAMSLMEPKKEKQQSIY